MTMFNDDLLAELDASVADVAHAVTLPAELYTSAEALQFEREAGINARFTASSKAAATLLLSALEIHND